MAESRTYIPGVAVKWLCRNYELADKAEKGGKYLQVLVENCVFLMLGPGLEFKVGDYDDGIGVCHLES